MNNKTNLENIANRVISKIPNKSDNFGFVITVLMIISIILTLIRIIQECDKTKLTNCSQNEKYDLYDEQIKSLSIKRSWFTKMTIKKIIRKEISSENYKLYGHDIMQAILSTGENLNKEDIKTLVEASNV